MTPHPTPSSSCPFCKISSLYPPIAPSSFLSDRSSSSSSSSSKTASPSTSSEGQAHLVLSTRHVLAFLDIMPLTRGHLLLITREHHEKLGEIGVRDGQELGKWLPIISRVVTRTVLGKDAPESDMHWNVVQNNGARAAQLVPHVHFHVIPRPNTDVVPTGTKMSWVMFGRGQRDDLDDEEGEQLARAMREELAREVIRIKESEGIDLDMDSEPQQKGRSQVKL
ncbi:hypothetical protein DTO271G3_7223 [Paecilomyces variotii]|nr:hypothetical protein DTO271G3_7223 [Paecilomyces variotii]